MNLFFISSLCGVILYALVWSARRNLRGGAPRNIADVVPTLHPLTALTALLLGVIIILFFFYGRGLLPGDRLYELHVAISGFGFVQILLGLAFGFTFGDWARYILHPKLLQYDDVRKAHSRWGFVLLVLLLAGTLLPEVKGQLTNIASFSSPAISFTLQTQQVSKPVVTITEAPAGKRRPHYVVTQQSTAIARLAIQTRGPKRNVLKTWSARELVAAMVGDATSTRR